MSSKGQRGLLDINFGQVEQEYPARPGSKKRKNIDGVGITDVNSKLALLSNTREIVDWHADASTVWMSHVVEPILPNIKVLSTTFVPNSVPVIAKETERHLPALRTACVRMKNCKLDVEPILRGFEGIQSMERVVVLWEDTVWLKSSFPLRASLRRTEHGWPLDTVVHIIDPNCKIESAEKPNELPNGQRRLECLFSFLHQHSVKTAEKLLIVGLEKLDLPVLRRMTVGTGATKRPATAEEIRFKIEDWFLDWASDLWPFDTNNTDELDDLVDRVEFLTLEDYMSGYMTADEKEIPWMAEVGTNHRQTAERGPTPEQQPVQSQ